MPLRLRLGDACHSLLGVDGHVIAVSKQGVVEIGDVGQSVRTCRFQAGGRVVAQPCARDGVLYLAAGSQLSAFVLGATAGNPPDIHARWTIALEGTAVHALTAVERRLYFTLSSQRGTEVYVIEDLERPSKPIRLHHGGNVSWIAADERTGTAVFLAECGDERLEMHRIGAEHVTRPLPAQPLPLHPIAVIGEMVFGILGRENRLQRIDLASGAVVESIHDDAQMFAISHGLDDRDWDRDAVIVDSNGVLFTGSGARDSFAPHERAVKGSPMIMRHCAAILGMADGRVRVYDLAHPPRHEVWLVGDGASPITALASFDRCVAVGNAEGIVEVRTIGSKGHNA